MIFGMLLPQRKNASRVHRGVNQHGGKQGTGFLKTVSENNPGRDVLNQADKQRQRRLGSQVADDMGQGKTHNRADIRAPTVPLKKSTEQQPAEQTLLSQGNQDDQAQTHEKGIGHYHGGDSGVVCVDKVRNQQRRQSLCDLIGHLLILLQEPLLILPDYLFCVKIKRDAY